MHRPGGATSAIGCQTYTWEMLGDAWRGATADLLDAIAVAGYDGLEITRRTAGEFRDDPAGLAAACRARDLALTTLAFSRPSGFTDPSRVEEDLVACDEAIAFAVAAGCRTFGLGGAASRGPGERAAQRRQAIQLYNAMAGRVSAAGLVAHVHPSSHHGSVIETEAEYEEVLAETDPAHVWFGPDTGHMPRGGIEVVPFLRRHRARIAHVHIKDVAADGAWALLGTGLVDARAVFAMLVETGYTGWVMLEEEAEAARTDPAWAVRRNRAWLRDLGY